MTISRLLTLGATLALIATGCGQKKTTTASHDPKSGQPVFRDRAEIAQYSALSDSGYRLLDQGRIAEAVAAFTAQAELIPSGRGGAFNVACAYGRSGDVAQSIEWLGKAVDAGWEDVDQMRGDPDLASARTDPRFEDLAKRAEATRASREGAFANGLPQYERSPVAFASQQALSAWADSTTQRWSQNRAVWHETEAIAAGLDIEARRLAGMRDLGAAGGDFDYGLERVRAISSIRSPRAKWGPLARGVLRETDAYLAGGPSPAGASEAHFRAGVAAYCESNVDDPASPGWTDAAAASRGHFAQVEAGSALAGSAAAWLLRIDLAEAGDRKETLLPKIKSFASTYGSDERGMDIAATFFHTELVRSRWPIPIESFDIDNKPVSLDQYKGRVVLVDFWATWCGPCRGELPILRDAHAKFAPQGFEILSVSLDFPERTTLSDYRNWIGQNGMTWRHIYEQKGWKSALAGEFLVGSIPSPILIGRRGQIAAMGDECRGDALVKAIEKALAEPA